MKKSACSLIFILFLSCQSHERYLADSRQNGEVQSPTLEDPPESPSDSTEAPTNTFYLFQNSYNTGLKNRDGSTNVQAGGVDFMYSIAVHSDANDSGKLKFFVNDRNNYRILIFNELPESSSDLPDVVVGQPDFSSKSQYGGSGSASANGFSGPRHMAVCDNGMFFVADATANRVLGYNRIPTSNGTPADFVLGQNSFLGTGTGTSATTMNAPYSVTCYNQKLYVTDRGNDRILVYDPIPTATGTPASYAIGQPDLNTHQVNICDASHLKTPYEVHFHQNKMYIADGYNHRILVYDSIPTASGGTASVFLGQANGTSCLMNRTNTLVPSQNSFNAPNSMAFVGNSYLAVTDNLNNRVLFFSLPIQTGANPVAILGQADYVSATITNPPTETSLTNPKGLYIDAKRIWIGDNTNRVIVRLLPNNIMP